MKEEIIERKHAEKEVQNQLFEKEIVLKERNGDVTLTVKDDGIGLPKEFDIAESTGFGMMLIKMLIDQLDGTFTIDNDGGLKTVIKFCI